MASARLRLDHSGGLERPEVDRGRKTLDIGLTALDGEPSAKEGNPFLESIIMHKVRWNKQVQDETEIHRNKERLSATHFVLQYGPCFGEDVVVEVLQIRRLPVNGLGLGW